MALAGGMPPPPPPPPGGGIGRRGDGLDPTMPDDDDDIEHGLEVDLRICNACGFDTYRRKGHCVNAKCAPSLDVVMVMTHGVYMSVCIHVVIDSEWCEPPVEEAHGDS